MLHQSEPWEQLPYAREYLAEAIFYGPMSAIHLPYGWNESERSETPADDAYSLSRHALHTRDESKWLLLQPPVHV